MPLSVRSSYEELRHQLEELRKQGYYYIGEYVFAGSHGAWNKVDVDAFHLWNVSHGDELDRIVMLFADLPANRTVTLVIEGRRVCRSEAANGSFLLDAVKTLGDSCGSVRVEDLYCTEITSPTRLIYTKPLFLTLLYRCNLLLEGHNLWTLCKDGTECHNAGKRKDKLLLENIRQDLREYFELEQWEERVDFRDPVHEHDDLTRQICELGKCLDGLQVIRQNLTEENTADDDMPGVVVWKKRCQRIDDMICVVKSRLRLLERSSRMEIPFPAPEKTLALWRMNEAFPDGMGFGEMVHIRTQLEHTLYDLQKREPAGDMPKRRALWGYRVEMVYQQTYQMDKLLEEKLQDHELDWEDYLV